MLVVTHVNVCLCFTPSRGFEQLDVQILPRVFAAEAVTLNKEEHELLTGTPHTDGAATGCVFGNTLTESGVSRPDYCPTCKGVMRKEELDTHFHFLPYVGMSWQDIARLLNKARFLFSEETVNT